MAVTHIVLDQTIPAGLWLNLVSKHGEEGRETPSNGCHEQWVHTKNLPPVVEICAFPSWAQPFVLPSAADVVADFLGSTRAKESTWALTLCKAKLVVVEEEEEEEEEEEKEEEEEEIEQKPTKTRTPAKRTLAKRALRGSGSKPKKRLRAGAVVSGDDGPGSAPIEIKIAAELARYKAAEAQMASEIASYKHKEARVKMRAELETEMKPSYDKNQEELVALRKHKMAAEIRAKLKEEFKEKKQKLNQQLEHSQERTAIIQERHQAEQAERIKDLQRSKSKEQPRQQQGPGQWEQLQGPGQWVQQGPGQWAQLQGPGQWAQLQGPGQWAQQGPGQWAQQGPGQQWSQLQRPGQNTWTQQQGPGQWAQQGPGQWTHQQWSGQWGPGQWTQQQGPRHVQWAQEGPDQWEQQLQLPGPDQQQEPEGQEHWRQQGSGQWQTGEQYQNGAPHHDDLF